MMCIARRSVPVLILLTLCLPTSKSWSDDRLEKGVRGIATRAPAEMKIDGDLSEFADAFCTPVEYFHPNWKNRSAQFFYMWDDEAFYSALQTLDEHPANKNPDNMLWMGDAVEWYFDTRRGDNFRNKAWEPGSVHCYWTGLTGTDIKGRFCLRPGYLDAIPKIGVEVGARKTEHGLEVEFKLPWENFPEFTPQENAVIGLDAEVCYSDGESRVDRTFAYGSPLSVSQPASQAKIQLVDALERSDWKKCGAVMMPMRVDVPWGQPTAAHAYASIALPPNHSGEVGRIIFQITDLTGHVLGEYEAEKSVFGKEGNFAKATAHWPIDDAPPGACHVTAIIYDTAGEELTRVAPRLVSVNMQQGY